MKTIPRLPKKIIKFILLNANDPIVKASWDIGFFIEEAYEADKPTVE